MSAFVRRVLIYRETHRTVFTRVRWSVYPYMTYHSATTPKAKPGSSGRRSIEAQKDIQRLREEGLWSIFHDRVIEFANVFQCRRTFGPAALRKVTAL